MKLIKKSKNNSAVNSAKDREQLTELEKKNHNKPLNTGNFIEKKWFRRSEIFKK